MLFAKDWMKLTGLNEKEIKKGNPTKAMALAFITGLITAFILAQFINYAGARNLFDGLKIGLMAWLGFTATVSAHSVIFEGKSEKLYALNMGYQIISFAVMGVILAMMA